MGLIQYIVYRVVSIVCNVLFAALMARAILSWFAQPSYYSRGNNVLVRIYYFLVKITEPIIGPFRRLLMRTPLGRGPLDFSVMVCGFAIIFIERLLIKIIFLF
jgi:uncharacterized protein YggT (Ycf19 family)